MALFHHEDYLQLSGTTLILSGAVGDESHLELSGFAIDFDTNYELTLSGSIVTLSGSDGTTSVFDIEDALIDLGYPTSDWIYEQHEGLSAEIDKKSYISDIINNLTTIDFDKPLAANQGKILKDHVDTINSVISSNDPLLDTVQDLVDYTKTIDTDLGDHTSDITNPHNVTQTQVGLGNVDNTSDVDKPISDDTQTALDLKTDESNFQTHLSSFDDHTSDTTNPHTVTKDQVGLGNVDNTSDIDKPVSTATQAALDLKTDETDFQTHLSSFDEHASDTTNPHTVTKDQVGLGNVDNTSDVDKPISDDTQTALDLKSNLSSFDYHTSDTTNPHNVTQTQVGLSNVDNTADVDKPVSTAQEVVHTTLQGNIDSHTGNINNPHTVTKDQVGLGNVDNTADINKPVSVDQNTVHVNLQSGIDSVSTSISNHKLDTTNPHNVTKDQVGLGDVDNTSDADKPISDDTQTALDGTIKETQRNQNDGFVGIDANHSIASGINSIASGQHSIASGANSTASGYSTTASGNYSTASNYNSLAFGASSTASGYYSVAFGSVATASGNYSSASGKYGTASGHHSTASGHFSTASGDYSTASGTYSTASGHYSIASGRHSVTHDPNNPTTNKGDNAIASGDYSKAWGIHSIASGERSIASGMNSIASGKDSTASGNYSTASGRGSIASGLYSKASGYYTTASGDSSTASGSYSTASGSYSVAFGKFATASGYTSTASGSYTTANGDFANAVGASATANGDHSTASGSYTVANGNYSTAIGCRVKTTINNTHEIGHWSNGTTRGGSVRMNSNGVVAMTCANSSTKLTDGGVTTGSEPDGSLIRNGCAIRRNGLDFFLDFNDAGTVKTLALGTVG